MLFPNIYLREALKPLCLFSSGGRQLMSLAKKIKSLTVLFWFLGFSQNGTSQPYANGTDISCIFLREKETPPLDRRHFELRDHYHFLLIPGMFSSVFKNFWDFPIPYFDDYVEFFKEMEADYTVIPVNSQDGPENNRSLIVETILSIEKPVIIISHSYGGLYGLNALIKNKQLRSQVRGFVAVQTPLGGSKIAKPFITRRILKTLATSVLHFLGAVRKDCTKSHKVEQDSARWSGLMPWSSWPSVFL